MLDVDWEWIKTSWLKSWLDEIVDAKVPEIDHTSVVCPHEKWVHVFGSERSILFTTHAIRVVTVWEKLRLLFQKKKYEEYMESI